MSGEFNYNLPSAYGGFSRGRNNALPTLITPLAPSFTPPSGLANRGANNSLGWGRSRNDDAWDYFLSQIHAEPILFLGSSNFGAPIFAWDRHQEEQASRLSREEQARAVENLKKTTYNPGPKKLAARLCLYYRDQARDVAKEMERQKEEEGKRCAVCLEDFEVKDEVMLTPCNHMFHEECIVPWARSHGHCPVCRFPLLSKPATATAATATLPAGTGRSAASRPITTTNATVGDLVAVVAADDPLPTWAYYFIEGE